MVLDNEVQRANLLGLISSAVLAPCTKDEMKQQIKGLEELEEAIKTAEIAGGENPPAETKKPKIVMTDNDTNPKPRPKIIEGIEHVEVGAKEDKCPS